MSFVAGRGGGMVGGGAGGGRGGGWGCGGGGGGHGGDDDDARRALIRSVGAKKRAARRWLNWGRVPPQLLHDYVPGGRFYNHLPPLPHAPVIHAPPPPPLPWAHGEGSSSGAQHVYAHTDEEEREFIARATAESAAAIKEMLRRDDAEIARQMAIFRAREAAEREAKRARVEDAIVVKDDDK